MQTDVATTGGIVVRNASDAHDRLVAVTSSQQRGADYSSRRSGPVQVGPRRMLPSLWQLVIRLNEARCQALEIETRVEAARARCLDRHLHPRSHRRM
jgi:hypothetical protein